MTLLGLPPLSPLDHQGHWRTPVANSAADVAFPKAPARALPHIRLILETGHELEIPLTQDAIDRLAMLLEPLRTQRA
jgi:hypothetical protein